MQCVLCDKNYQLGISNFGNDSSPEKDPLASLFENEFVSFQNPETKQSEKRPVFDAINSQIEEKTFSETRLKMFPPVILPPSDIPHGFPKSFPENHMDFDNKNTKKLGDGDIEDKDEYKKKWFPKLLEHQAESDVSRAFQSVFSERRGFLIQNYHSGTYLQPILEKAGKQRKDKTKNDEVFDKIKLLPLEQKIYSAMNIAIIEDNNAYSKELQDRSYEIDQIMVLEAEKLFVVVETKSRVKEPENCISGHGRQINSI